MIPPYELENKHFKKAVKGYNTTEVDEHIDFVVDKYTELYRAYNELERKQAELSAELEVFKNNEDAIRRALVDAQNTKAKIIKDATRRSEVILRSAKENSDKIIADFREQISSERATLATLRAQVEEFKFRIFSQYQQHIEYLEQISPDKDGATEWNLPVGEYASKVVAQIVLDVENADKKADAEDKARPRNDEDDLALDTLVSDSSDKLTFPTEKENDENEGDTASFPSLRADNIPVFEKEKAAGQGALIPIQEGVKEKISTELPELFETPETDELNDTLMFVIDDIDKKSQNEGE